MAAAGPHRRPAGRDCFRPMPFTGQSGETGGFAQHPSRPRHPARPAPDRAIWPPGGVAFLALDNMISNGFKSWLWDGARFGRRMDRGRAGHRPGAAGICRLIRSPAGRLLQSGGAARSSPLEASRAIEPRPTAAALRRGDVAFLARAWLDRLQAPGRRADRLPGPGAWPGRAGTCAAPSLTNIARAVFQQSIFVHEGRHALDRSWSAASPGSTTPISNIEPSFPSWPSPIIRDWRCININAATIGGGSAHGNANAQDPARPMSTGCAAIRARFPASTRAGRRSPRSTSSATRSCAR